jgi:large subunit ribosomal protein L17
MRHQNKKGRLSRGISWRKATLKSMTNDLLTYQRIETTLAKAKALRSFAEPIITLAKNNPDSVSARRKAFSKLCDRKVVTSLFNEIGPLFKDIPGGYTRIMPLGNRRGDGAQMVILELTKRTISDEDLLGITKEKEKVKRKKVKDDAKAKDAENTEGKPHSAPEVDIEAKEERAVEDVKKEKAKNEQKKIQKKGGLFKRFQRKSI